MTTLNLTRPISARSMAGRSYPWEAPYRTEDIATLEHNGANLFYISMGAGGCTRLAGPGLASPTGAMVHEVPLDLLVDHPAVVVRIPRGAKEAVGVEDVDRAFGAVSDLRRRDSVVVATGWADGERWRTDEGFFLDAPYLTPEAADRLADRLEDNGSRMLLTDCPTLDPFAGNVRGEWLSLPPWLRPPWPSDAARTYLEHYTAEKAAEDWQATTRLTSRLWTVLGLHGCSALGAVERIRLNVVPLMAQDVGEAPCTVVATY